MREKLRKGEFLANVTVMSAGRVGGQLFILATIPVLARMFPPEAFGAWDTGRAVAGIALAIGAFSYEKAVVLPKDADEAADVFILAITVLSTVSVMFFVLILYFNEYFGALLGEGSIIVWQVGLPLYVFLFGVRRLMLEVVTRQGNFSRFSVGVLIGALAHTGVPIVAAIAVSTASHWLMIGVLAEALVVITVVMMTRSTSDWAFLFKVARLKRIGTCARSYIDFAMYKTPLTFSETLGQRAVPIMLNIFSGTQVVGYFGIAERISMIPVSAVIPALRQVFYGKAARTLDVGSLGPKVSQGLRYQIAIVVPAVTVLIATAPWLVSFGLGSQWQEATPYFQWLVIMSGGHFTTAWLDRMYAVARRQGLALLQQVIFESIRLFGILALLWFGYEPVIAVAFYASADVLFNVYWLYMTFHISGLGAARVNPLMRLLVWNVCLWMAIALGLTWLFASPWGQSVLGIAGMMAILAILVNLRKVRFVGA